MGSSREIGGRTGRLKSWKEIAAFFGADERTVRRWEERGLPVRRVPGGARATVYAEVSELEAWLDGRRQAAQTAGAARPARLARGLAALAVVLLAAVAVITYTRGGGDAAAFVHQPPRGAVEHYLAATYQFERRTPESLQQALDGFGEAIADDPAYAEAHAGIANTYLLLREFAGMPDAEAYPLARAAAERALRLDDRLAQAHAALAFVTFYADRDWQRGIATFERAIELDPDAARPRHWYATALFHTGQIEPALAAISEAQRRDPQSRSILADKALILFHAGRVDDALAILQPLAANEPEFLSSHSYLATIHLAGRNYGGYLREARAAARLTGDRQQLATLDSAASAYETGGREAMLAVILERTQRLHEDGQASAYAVAAALAQLGRNAAALDYLEASERAREPEILAVRVDPRLRPLGAEARFRALAARIGTTAA